jgi:hypothetical protein
MKYGRMGVNSARAITPTIAQHGITAQVAVSSMKIVPQIAL